MGVMFFQHALVGVSAGLALVLAVGVASVSILHWVGGSRGPGGVGV